MPNNIHRNSLTRDEIIGILLGWIKGPCVFEINYDEQLSAEEQDIIESHTYNVLEDLFNRRDNAYEINYNAVESGACSSAIEDFRKEEIKYNQVCNEVDDEISKGERSALRVDRRLSTSVYTFYTRISFDEWVSKKPDLSVAGLTIAKPITRKKPEGEVRRNAILTCIRALGHDPKRLPKRDAGRRGIKAEVRAKLEHGKEPFPNSTAFDRAWEKLRKMGMIKEIA